MLVGCRLIGWDVNITNTEERTMKTYGLIGAQYASDDIYLEYVLHLGTRQECEDELDPNDVFYPFQSVREVEEDTELDDIVGSFEN